SEPLGAPRVAVHDDLGRVRLAEGDEELAQLGVVRVVGEIAHIEFHRTVLRAGPRRHPPAGQSRERPPVGTVTSPRFSWPFGFWQSVSDKRRANEDSTSISVS